MYRITNVSPESHDTHILYKYPPCSPCSSCRLEMTCGLHVLERVLEGAGCQWGNPVFVRPQTSHFIPLGLSFLVCKMRIVTPPLSPSQKRKSLFIKHLLHVSSYIRHVTVQVLLTVFQQSWNWCHKGDGASKRRGNKLIATKKQNHDQNLNLTARLYRKV